MARTDSCLEFYAVGGEDANGDDYYFSRPDLPVTVNLSEVVFFFHPEEATDKKKFGMLVRIKRDTGKRKRRDDKPA